MTAKTPDLTGAMLESRNGRAPDVGKASIGGNPFLLDDPDLWLRPTIRGRVELGRITIHGGLLIRIVTLQVPASGTGRHDYNANANATATARRAAVVAPGLSVGGDRPPRGPRSWRGALPRPWEQAVRVLRDNGDTRGPERLLIAHARHRRQARIGRQGYLWADGWT